jgi:hypothetical protein
LGGGSLVVGHRRSSWELDLKNRLPGITGSRERDRLRLQRCDTFEAPFRGLLVPAGTTAPTESPVLKCR